MLVKIKQDLEYAEILIKSGLLPSYYKTPEQVVVVMAKGRELGIQPLHSLSHIYIVDNQPSLRGELMLFLIRRLYPQAPIHFDFSKPDRVVIQAARSKDEELQTFVWTLEMSKHLRHKKCWREYPRAMLAWRCVAEMARLLFADALQGCSYTPEELGEETNQLGVPVRLVQPLENAGNADVVSVVSSLIEKPVATEPEKIKPELAPSAVAEKLKKLENVLTGSLVGFSVQELEVALASPQKQWSEAELKDLESAVRLAKKSNTASQNKNLVTNYLSQRL